MDFTSIIPELCCSATCFWFLDSNEGKKYNFVVRFYKYHVIGIARTSHVAGYRIPY